MTIDELMNWSLTEGGRNDLSKELRHQCRWLYHDSWSTNYHCIRQQGLLPKDPSQGGPTSPRHHLLREANPEMISFAATPNLLPTKHIDDPDLFTLALAADDFPAVVLDWSFPDMLEEIECKIASLSQNAVATAVVREIVACNAIAFVDPISADCLLVKTLGAASLLPDQWPLLAVTDAEDVSFR